MNLDKSFLARQTIPDAANGISNQSKGDIEPRGPLGRVGFILLALMAAVIVSQRIYTYAEPLDRDIAGYALIGHEWLQGRLLYTDLWERKPPLLFGTFAAAERFVGYGAPEVFLVNVASALATLLGIFAAGRLVGTAGGLLAGGLWMMLCADLPMEANQPNAEVFVNAFLTAGFALLVRWPSRRSYTFATCLGLAFTAATFYKQHVIVTCAALAITHVVAGRREVRDRLIELAVAASVGAVAWGSVLGYFRAVGRLRDLVDALFIQNVTYSGGLGSNLVDAVSPKLLFPGLMVWVIAPATIVGIRIAYAIAGSATGRGKPYKRGWILLGTWMASTALSVALPGHFYYHYYQLWIPPWCIAGGWATAGVVGRDIPFPRMLRIGTVALIFIALCCRQAMPFRWSVQQWAYLKDPENTFEEDDRLGRILSKLLDSNQTFYNLGEEDTIYFAAQKSPPSGLLYLEPLVSGGETETYWKRLMLDLHRRPPDLVVGSKRWLKWFRQDSPIVPWLRELYRPVNTDLGCPDYYLLVRRDSSLSSRLPHRTPTTSTATTVR